MVRHKKSICLTGRTEGPQHQITMYSVEFEWADHKPKVRSLLQKSFNFVHCVTSSTFPCVISLELKLNCPVCCLIPAKALEILSFFHSQGWSYSSGGRSSSCGSLLSLGQRERSGSESPPFSAGSYGVSYRGSCLTDPSFGPLPPDRISKKRWKDWTLLLGSQPLITYKLRMSPFKRTFLFKHDINTPWPKLKPAPFLFCMLVGETDLTPN